VKHLLSPLLVLSLLLFSTGCGNVFVCGAIETGSTIQGSVSFVQLGNTLNGMETIQVTNVTLLQNSMSSTIGFLWRSNHPVPAEPNRARQLQSWTALRDRHRCGYRCLTCRAAAPLTRTRCRAAIRKEP
jgi:hypothetical protein